MPPKRKTSSIRQDPPAKNWCFTIQVGLNQSQYVAPSMHESFRFMCFQLEKSPSSGQYHIQGYFQLENKQRLTAIKEFGDPWRTCHLEKSKGSATQNVKYCSKPETAVEGTFVRIGTPSIERIGSERGAGLLALQTGASLQFIREEYPSYFIQSYRAIERYIQLRDAHKPSTWVLPNVLHEWQKGIMDTCSISTNNPVLGQPHDRRVNWIVDAAGAAGKSTLVKMLVQKYESKAVIVTTSSVKRLVEAMLPQQHVVLLDLPRDYDILKFNYSGLEVIKDGIGARTMYTPETRTWTNPHLFVFSNKHPDQSKLTHDRWNIIILS